MSDIPWDDLLIGIGGVAILVVVLSEVYSWAVRYGLDGNFSGVLSAIGTIGRLILALLGGGLLVAVGWLFGWIPDSEF